jgi:acyl carrier protein
MNTIDDFLTLLRDEMGLPVSVQDTSLHLDEVDCWDSVHLLFLLTILERRTGRPMPFVDVLEAQSLNDIYALAVAE